MSDLDELTSRVPPPDEPPPPVDWDAARAALGAELPADYRALVERYGAGAIAGLRLLVPGHPNRHVDLLRQVEPQRWALRRLMEQGIEQPYDPDALLPWGIDEGGNVVWWLTEELARRRQRGARRGVAPHEGGAVAFLAAILAGREKSDFLVIEGDDFEPFPYEAGA